jgi:Spy/CpxP family protein refolding chaperone
MATRGAAPRAMWARKVITAALAAGAMAVAAPAGIAVADPTNGPNGGNNPAINDYANKVKALADQYTADGPSGSGTMSQQQFADQLRAANDQLRDALIAAVPTGLPGQ